MAIFDPRSQESLWFQPSHSGTKAQKMQWMSEHMVVTAGFTKMNEREYAVWDIRNQGAEPIATGGLPEGSGIPHIYYDCEHELLYNSGRGDGSIQFFQYSEQIPNKVAFLGKFSHGQACKSFSLLPKHSLDPNKHEVGRSVRYLADNTLDYIGFRLPNRTGAFQEDLYPPFPANEPSNDIESWLAGTDKPVKTMQLRPGEENSGALQKKKTFKAKLQGGGDDDGANDERLAELEAQVKSLTTELEETRHKLQHSED